MKGREPEGFVSSLASMQWWAAHIATLCKIISRSGVGPRVPQPWSSA